VTIPQKLIARIKDQSGTTVVLVAMGMVVLIGFAALAVDIGYTLTTKNELQNVADAAALAATRQLGAIYQGMSYDEQQTYVGDPQTLVDIATEVAAKNQAGGMNITIQASDVTIGDWDASTLTLTPTLAQPDAVRVIARRDGTANGPITTFFARIFGIDTVDVNAKATAALTGQGTTEPGDLEVPLGIPGYWFTNNSCNGHIKFSPTGDPDACAGWTSFTENANDSNIRKILEELIDSQDTVAGETMFNFIGGELSTNTFNAFLTLFQHRGYDVDNDGNPILGPDGEPLVYAGDEGIPFNDAEGNRLYYPDDTPRNKHEWSTTVAVYAWDNCDNPNASIGIGGYARINITDVLGPPDKLIEGAVVCEYVDSEDTRGGGGEYGTMGSIPGLVE
jgi:Flp pilus assembly protein TadG